MIIIPSRVEVEKYMAEARSCKTCKGFGPFRKLSNKMCDGCIDKLKCEHGKQKRLCRECGGKAYCVHNKRKEFCSECGGGSLCEHRIRKEQCRECKGAAFCIHLKFKYSCTECGTGSQLCEHKKRKTECKLCGGKKICSHHLIIDNCKLCKGCNIFEHNRRRSHCVECEGSGICIHKKVKYDCSECKLSTKFCEHGIRKAFCKGAQICTHGKQKIQCIICRPDHACLHCKSYYVPKTYRFHPYCFTCYCVLHPEVDIPRKYKLKEHYMTDYLKEECKEAEMVFDKRVEDGCSKRRPDVRIDRGTHTIIIECDENQHKGYSCETKRTMELFQDCGSRPIVFLRWNPDSYTREGLAYKGCFNVTKTGLSVDKKEFGKRMKALVERIAYFQEHLPEKEVIVEEYYYS